jgi:hypothetical protein
MAYFIFLKYLDSLEDFRKNPHVKIPPKSPCTIFQSSAKFKNQLKFEKNFFLNSGPALDSAQPRPASPSTLIGPLPFPLPLGHHRQLPLGLGLWPTQPARPALSGQHAGPTRSSYFPGRMANAATTASHPPSLCRPATPLPLQPYKRVPWHPLLPPLLPHSSLPQFQAPSDSALVYSPPPPSPPSLGSITTTRPSVRPETGPPHSPLPLPPLGRHHCALERLEVEL